MSPSLHVRAVAHRVGGYKLARVKAEGEVEPIERATGTERAPDRQATESGGSSGRRASQSSRPTVASHRFTHRRAQSSGGLGASTFVSLLVLPVAFGLTLLVLGAVVTATFVSPVTKVASSILNTKVPASPPPLAQTTYLYDRNGKFITTLHSGINRTEIPFSQMPQSLKDAVVSIEDKNFYREGGVSVSGTIRAAVIDFIHHQAVQGGSTITQQYVKQVYTGGERTVSRKLKEAVIADKISRMYTKDQILEKYLNTVYFGSGAYGAQAAAQTYWHKGARKLSVLQSATLAAMIQAPSTYNPYTVPQIVRERRNLVLRDMAQQGYLDPTEEAKLEAATVKVLNPETGPTPAAYFVDDVSRTLQAKYGVDQTFGGGLRVTTTLDWAYQRAAEQAIASHLTDPHDPSAALVAIDPGTGDIRAMVGGRDFTRVKFNLATQAHRQAGSAFKPFTFAAATQQHIDPNATMVGPPELTVPDQRCFDPTKNEQWKVSNFADESAGTMSLFDALKHSVNTIFAQLVVDVGPDKVAAVAHKMGIQSPLHAYCSITLGSQPVTPLEMTDAYATIASRGIHHAPQVLGTVKSADGRTVGTSASATGKRVLSQNDADILTEAMQGVVTGGTGTAAYFGRPVAGKTGTGQNFQDAWFCGFAPQLTTCVWVGYPKGEIPMRNVEGFADVFGGSIPAEIWHDFMSTVMAKLPVEGFVQPDLTGYDVQPERIVPIYIPPPTPVATTPAPTPSCHHHNPTKCGTGTPSPSPSPSPTTGPSP